MILLVDGYNLYYSGIEQPGKNADLEKVRRRVISIVQHYCLAQGCRGIIFFDGGPKGQHLSRRNVGTHVEIQYSPTHSDADTEIKNYISQHQNRSELKVISSDREIQRYAAASRVPSMYVRPFLTEVVQLPKPKEGVLPDEPPEKYSGAAGSDDVEFWLREFTKPKKRKL
jgi:predicted RNA-binding protein with PIN domain